MYCKIHLNCKKNDLSIIWDYLNFCIIYNMQNMVLHNYFSFIFYGSVVFYPETSEHRT